MITVIQTVAGAGQFTGAPGVGGLDFASWDALPPTDRIVLDTIALHVAIDGGGAPLGEVSVYLVQPGGPATARVLLGRGLAAAVLGPAGDADFTICGPNLLREPWAGNQGQWWTLEIITVSKTQTGTVTIAWHVEPGDRS